MKYLFYTLALPFIVMSIIGNIFLMEKKEYKQKKISQIIEYLFYIDILKRF